MIMKQEKRESYVYMLLLTCLYYYVICMNNISVKFVWYLHEGIFVCTFEMSKIVIILENIHLVWFLKWCHHKSIESKFL